YRDLEIGGHFKRGSLLDMNATYVRSTAEGDLNTLTSFFDAVLSPIVGANAYAPLATDVSHRLLVRGRLAPTRRWLLLAIGDWHTGAPYSTTNEMRDFVGPRSVLRFPNAFQLEMSVE